MARFRAEDVDRYGGQGGGGYFRLANDKDVATVRFLYNGIDDVEGLSVHRVEVDGKNRYVNCLREYNDPVDACPFCRERMYTTAKLFIPVYNVSEDKIQIWERGKQFFQKISSLCSRYENLVSHEFEVERHGKANDTSTTYEVYEVNQDDTTLEDFDVPDVVGGVVLDKSAEDMEYYIESGEFPPADEAPVRRREQKRTERREEREERVERRSARRTPARRSDDEAKF